MTEQDDREGRDAPEELEQSGRHGDETAADMPPEAEAAVMEDGGDDIRHLLRGALTKDDRPPPDVLGGVQRKLRQRSRGKFYRDEWSTAREPPIATYLVTSLLMLVFVVFVFAFLRYLSGEPAAARGPDPVNIIPPPPKHR